MAEQYDVIIIGAGAAGLMCAMTAGTRGCKVLLVDHAEEVGKKILISGGGRCNFTNLHCTPERFISANPHFCKSALARYDQHDFITLVEKHGIAYHEKTLGQLFCDGSAREIVDMLVGECITAGIEIRTGVSVIGISKPDRFEIIANGAKIVGVSLVLATGGLSIPKMGATDFTHRLVKQFGLAVTDTAPGLVPLTFTDDDLALMHGLSGISQEALVTCGKTTFRENVLFTHRGLSGPAILQASSYWRPGDIIRVNLLPELDAAAYLIEQKAARPRAEARTVLAEMMSRRLAEALVERTNPPKPLAETADKDLAALGARLNDWRLAPTGSEGYAKAEVTVGGVDTVALSSKTMEAKAVPGLYVVGEAVDVTGWLGGYNFQWAWSSGWAAGNAV